MNVLYSLLMRSVKITVDILGWMALVRLVSSLLGKMYRPEFKQKLLQGFRKMKDYLPQSFWEVANVAEEAKQAV